MTIIAATAHFHVCMVTLPLTFVVSFNTVALQDRQREPLTEGRMEDVTEQAPKMRDNTWHAEQRRIKSALAGGMTKIAEWHGRAALISATSGRAGVDRLDAKAYLDELLLIEARLDSELRVAEQGISELPAHLRSSSRILAFRQSAVALKERLTEARHNFQRRLEA